MTVLSANDRATEAPAAGLHLHLAPDHATLTQSFIGSLHARSDDPFRPILVVIPGAAQRRHLSMAIADRVGICAGYDFVTLGILRRRIQNTLLGIDPVRDQWRGRGMALGVLDAIDAHLGEPWLQPVARHLQRADERPGRRMATAVRITRNFRGYVQQAPGMLLDWASGRDEGPEGGPLPPTASWQPPMWRALRGVLGDPDPVERQLELVEAVRSGAVRGLGDTMHVIDLIGVGAPERELIEALARHHRVELWLVEHESSPGQSTLAASWGRARRADVASWQRAADRIERVASGPPPADHLLSLVKQDISAGTVSDTQTGSLTVEIHSSHGPDRQVEVLRDVLTGLFDDDPTLEPRDVVVACTDLDQYATHIHAAFGLADAPESDTGQHPGHSLRAQLATSSVSSSNPALGLLLTLLSLPGSRATAQNLIDLCSQPLIAHRFGFGTDDLASIRVLVEQAGALWGIDQRQRAAVGLGDVSQGTWSHALDRMFASVALPAEPQSALGDVLPIAAVESGTVALLGRLAELVALVDRSITDYASPAPVAVWIERFRRDIGALASVPLEDTWMIAHAHSELADLAELGAPRSALLSSADARGLVDGLLRPPRARANHGNGSLLFSTLDDVAGLPHRVVCVLGLASHHFPPRPRLDGDDLLGGRPTALMNDPRALARQRLLDAMMSAQDRFVVVTQGRDARTNADRPLPVILTDLIDACAPHTGGLPIVRQHSLQPQSERNFDAVAPFSFDVAAFVGAQERQKVSHLRPSPRQPGSIRFPGDQASDSDIVELASLISFYRHPARELLRATFGVSLREYERGLPDELPIDLDGLTTWGLVDAFLGRNGLAWDDFVREVRLSGILPPGQLGSRALAEARDLASGVAERAQPFRVAAPEPVDLSLDLSSGARLTGVVDVTGSTLLVVTPSWVGGRHLIDAWLRLLCLAASGRTAPDGAWRSVLVGKGRLNTLLTAPGADQALERLDQLASVRAAGLRALVPLPPQTSAAALHVGRAAPLEPDLAEAADAWTRDCDHDWEAVLGGQEWNALTDVRFSSPGVCTDAGFADLAEWFWRPIVDARTVGVRA